MNSNELNMSINNWIREKLVDPKQFLQETTLQIRKNEAITFKYQPNFFYKTKNMQVFGWFSDEDEDEQLFVGITKSEAWILAVCNE